MTRHALKKELIGREMTVVDAKNKALVGISGRIIDETKNTLTIRKGKDEKKLIKEQIIFTTEIDNKRIQIDGSKIKKRPEKRLS